MSSSGIARWLDGQDVTPLTLADELRQRPHEWAVVGGSTRRVALMIAADTAALLGPQFEVRAVNEDVQARYVGSPGAVGEDVRGAGARCEHPPACNVSRVRDPKWKGTSDDAAVSVSLGEPARTPVQLWAEVEAQVLRYLHAFPPRWPGDNVQMSFNPIASITARLVADDRVGSGLGVTSVVVFREQLLIYHGMATQRFFYQGGTA